MTKLLVPTDGSPGSLNAVRFAMAFAERDPAAEIHLINVQSALPSAVTSFVAKEAVRDYHQEEGEKELAAARKLLDDANLNYRTEILVGSTGDRIARYARENKCAHIIMGTRGLGGLPNLLLGSVATRVLHLADVPVTLVK
jgi:nucleotide-binding universal stress UspA family protein